MIRALLCAAMVCAIPAEAKPATVQTQVDDLLAEIAVPGVDVKVKWTSCGMANGFYRPRDHSLTLCTEIGDDIGDALFTAAHEYGHAVIEQLDLPYTGSEEDAADEFAALTLSVTHNQAALFEEGRLFASGIWPEPPPWDTHAENKRRAYTLMCLATGSQVVEGELDADVLECGARWDRLVHTWGRLL